MLDDLVANRGERGRMGNGQRDGKMTIVSLAVQSAADNGCQV